MPAYPMKNSIAGIARRCGLSPSHVSRVMSGERKPGDTPAGHKLARLLETGEIAELFKVYRSRRRAARRAARILSRRNAAAAK